MRQNCVRLSAIVCAAVSWVCGLEHLRGHDVTVVRPPMLLDAWENVLSARQGDELAVQLCDGSQITGDYVESTHGSLTLSNASMARAEIDYVDHLQDHTARHQWRDVWLPAGVGGGIAGIIAAVAPRNEGDPSKTYFAGFFTALGAGIGLYQHWLDRQIAPVSVPIYDGNCDLDPTTSR